MPTDSDISASIVLNDMGGTQLARYGMHSWMLQDFTGPYEVILNLFNDKRPVFEKLAENKPTNCDVVIKEYPPPQVFNISAANNLGLHFARGKYVVFCNADVIMPSYYLRRLIAAMEKHDWHYFLGGRWNFTPTVTEKVGPLESYTRENNFDKLHNLVPGNGVDWGALMSPWVFRRDTAFAIGGFDSRVYCHEDMDVSDRTYHYVKRMGLQDVIPHVANYDMQGIHLWHQPGRLHVMSKASFQVMEPRRVRLWADPNSTEDCVNTPLHSLEELVKIMNASVGAKPPEDHVEPSTVSKVIRRVKNAIRVLRYGNF